MLNEPNKITVTFSPQFSIIHNHNTIYITVDHTTNKLIKFTHSFPNITFIKTIHYKQKYLALPFKLIILSIKPNSTNQCCSIHLFQCSNIHVNIIINKILWFHVHCSFIDIITVQCTQHIHRLTNNNKFW